jgi:hypothetical protein
MTVLQVGVVFAMAQKPATGTYYWYINRPYEVCVNGPVGSFGHPWAPNFQFQILKWGVDGKPVWVLDAAGNPVPNQFYNPSKPTYEPAGFTGCAKPYYDYAKACFKWVNGQQQKIACSNTVPA